MHIPSTILTAVEMVGHKGINNNQDVPSECHHASRAKEVVEGWPARKKWFFCPQAARAIPSSSFPQIPQKEYLGSWDRSHWRAFSHLLTASTTKGRGPLHVQSEQILQILIYVIRNLLLTSSASIHIDWRHSRDTESLSGCWPLKQAAKRVTSSLRDVPRARAPPHSQMCSYNFQLLARLGTSIHGV